MPSVPRALRSLLVSAEEAQKTAATFATQHLADILQVGTPYLIVAAEGLYWRVPLLLNHPTLFSRTPAATLDISTQTGQPRLTAEQQHQLTLQIYAAFQASLGGNC